MGASGGEPIEPGARVGRLVVERELGRGGFGVVYLARDEMLGRLVALKVLARPEVAPGPEDVGGFLAEARVIAKLHSPHIVTLYALHEQPGGGWMLEMEFVDGGTLRDLMRDGRGQSLEQTRRIVRGILTGLGTAHERGVLHRDIKPANVLVTADGTAKLTDFGLARVLGDDSSRLDSSGGFVGTPSYMAPEVLLGEPATRASDLWGVGVVVYQLLTGRLPFEAPDLPAFFFSIQNADVPLLTGVAGPQLQEIVARCLVRDPHDRTESCAALLALLDAEQVHRTAPPAPVVARPFFGRRAETARLDALLGRVRDGASAAVLVTGEPGIGKSALLERMCAAARAEGFVWLTATLSRFEGPLQALVDAMVESTRSDDSWRTADFGPAVGVVAKLRRGETAREFDSPEQAVWVLEHLFRGLAATRPICLCIEELRHAQEDDVVLLIDLARRLARSRFLLAIEARPEASLAARFAELPALERIALGGLSGEALYAFLEQSGGARRVPPEIAARIARRSDGNPLVAAELLRHLEQAGVLVREGERLVPGKPWTRETVPDRLRELVAVRVADLDEDARSLLEVAAVDGRVFDGQALAAVLEVPLIRALRRLQKLCRAKTLIAPADDGYRFTSALLQQVLYEEMAPELREALHRQLAEHLEQRGGAGLAERLVRHWEGCGEPAKARPHLLDLARRAARRQEQARLIDLCTRAGLLDAAPGTDLDDTKIELVLWLVQALGRIGRRDEAAHLLHVAHENAVRQGDVALEYRVALRRIDEGLVRERVPEEDRGLLRRITAHFGRVPEGGCAHQLLGTIAKREGDLDAAEREFRAAEGILRKTGPQWRLAATLDHLGSIALRAGRFEEAESLYDESISMALGVGRSLNAAGASVNRVVAAMSLGRLDGMEDVLERAMRTYELAGSTHNAAHVRVNLAELRYATGNVAGALDALGTAIPLLRRTGHNRVLSAALRLQGSILAVKGRLDDSEGLIAEARDLAERAGDKGLRAATEAVRAQLCCLQGDVDGARAAAGNAVELVGTAHEVGDLILLLVEAAAYGLPADALGAERLDQRATEFGRVVLAGARAFAAREVAIGVLSAAADALAQGPIGPRQATLRLVASLLRAESSLHQGKPHEAREAARHGLAAARAMGHVQLESVFKRAVERAG